MLPLLEEVELPRGAAAVPVVLKSEYFKAEESPYLINEFEKVYFELNNGALTPPQSPPSEPPVITTLLASSQYQKDAYPSPVPDKPDQVLAFPQPVVTYTSLPTPQPDIAHELAVVDELVRTRVEDMQWSSGPSSPESSSNGSSYGDCSSSEDAEWVPEPVENCNPTSSSAVQKPQKKRSTKPYSHNPDDKKIRKKEQNKNAATRYRMKKKAEVEVILGEEKQLLEKHGELNGQITDLQREIKYLKGLMRDLFKAKGLIN